MNLNDISLECRCQADIRWYRKLSHSHWISPSYSFISFQQPFKDVLIFRSPSLRGVFLEEKKNFCKGILSFFNYCTSSGTVLSKSMKLNKAKMQFRVEWLGFSSEQRKDKNNPCLYLQRHCPLPVFSHIALFGLFLCLQLSLLSKL